MGNTEAKDYMLDACRQPLAAWFWCEFEQA
jgi:hypothetical protein